MEELNGLVAIGTSATQLFDGSASLELLFVDLATGEERSLPLTEEQMSLVYSWLTPEDDYGQEEGLRAEAGPVGTAETQHADVREAPVSEDGPGDVGRPALAKVTTDQLRKIGSF